jgi:hypothetical protein
VPRQLVGFGRPGTPSNTDECSNAFAWRLAAGYSPLPQFEIDLRWAILSGFSRSERLDPPSPRRLDVRPVCLPRTPTPLPETWR